MSWRDRAYSGDGAESELRLQFRRPSSVVTWLIVANVAVYLIQLISARWSPTFLLETFGLSLFGIRKYYFWQLVSYMFVHNQSDVFHLVMNMLGLYIFGTEFERTFGRQRFLQFYTVCGIVGGIAYLSLSLFNPAYRYIPLHGASGAVWGLIIAAVIFFPAIQIVLIIFPMPVRVFALIYAGILVVQMLSGTLTNVGGELCHVSGAATGIVMFYAWGMMPRIRLDGIRSSGRLHHGAWSRKLRFEADEQSEVDRILAKIHTDGLNSLSRKERKTLANATRQQRERDEQLDRSTRL